ncbi:MAG: hypothetical protein INF75_01045 [Roseomonas sp.]|nr:hypothetical protein [Roseomonas sp.]MCA3328385.1 hypothetical protein [Roseomonas sp.]MCA3330845.1 hypothetical protein [Roseomonas sp.]MCA3333928.1 hypothetical protein [Roseomonas sp.]MCA3348277.1 hypothetical protein [Roseomonas sp.]
MLDDLMQCGNNLFEELEMSSKPQGNHIVKLRYGLAGFRPRSISHTRSAPPAPCTKQLPLSPPFDLLRASSPESPALPRQGHGYAAL